MNDRHDELVRRAAELKAESAALMMVSEELADRLAKRRQAGARAVEQPGEQGTAAAAPGGDRAGDVPVTWAEAGVLDEDEAMALAGLLEELAARHSPDPLSGQVLQAAALLRRRVAARQQRGIRPWPSGPAARREAGDTRDDDAGYRDTQAGQRDLVAIDRDDRAKERDLQADAADAQARASDQRISDLLWDGELRGGQWQPGQEEAGANRVREGEDREAIREMLAQAQVARQAARQDRHAAGQDRIAASRDRDSAQADRGAADRDRRTARADRDQAVIESEEADPR